MSGARRADREAVPNEGSLMTSVRRFNRRLVAALAGALAGGAVAASVVAASIPAPDGTINACYGNDSLLRVRDSNLPCKVDEHRLSWPSLPPHAYATHADQGPTLSGNPTEVVHLDLPGGSYVVNAKVVLDRPPNQELAGRQFSSAICQLRTAGGEIRDIRDQARVLLYTAPGSHSLEATVPLDATYTNTSKSPARLTLYCRDESAGDGPAYVADEAQLIATQATVVEQGSR
jgi:hypothetical protein